MRRKVLFAALVFALPSPAFADAATPLALAEIFCAAMVENASDPQALTSPALAAMIEAALARNAEIQAAVPDEKPPLGDGIPWASWPDKPNTCAVEITEAYDGAAMVNVTYGFSGAPDATYTDTLVLMDGDGGWAIDDVVLVDNQTLRALLETAFDP